DVVQGTVLDRAEVDRQIDLYRTRTADERRQIVGLQPKRAEVILAGACIVRTVMEKLGAPALRVSDRALRHGLLVERFQHKEVTPMATTTRQALSDEQLTELIGLIKGADSVELKLTVPESVHRSTISALGLDPLQAQIRQVFFFDTPDLTLNA